MRYTVRVGEGEYQVESLGVTDGSVVFAVNGKTYSVGITPHFEQSSSVGSSAPLGTGSLPPQRPKVAPPARTQRTGEICAPMPGIVCGIPVKVGEVVTAGQSVCVVEAMKMENNIPSPIAGKIATIHVSQGSEVGQGTVLITVTP